jgi:hypothetical protein
MCTRKGQVSNEAAIHSQEERSVSLLLSPIFAASVCYYFTLYFYEYDSTNIFLQNCGENEFLIFKPLRFWCFVMAALSSLCMGHFT